MKIIRNISTLFLVALLIECDTSNPVSSGISRGSQIVFTADNNLCIIDDGGSNFDILAVGPVGSFWDWEARITQDGSKIVYSNAESTFRQIYLLDLIEGTTTNLTNDSVYHESPAFSPDGKTLIYLTEEWPAMNIVSRNLESGEERTLTSGFDCSSPSFSLDGESIVFGHTNGLGVGIMRKDGTDLTLLPGPASNPQLSHDGSQVLHTASVNAFDSGLYVMNSDGSGRTLLSIVPPQTRPRFSPVEPKIMFSKFDGNSEIFAIDSNGGNLMNITNSLSAEFHPSFSPDGKRVVFLSADSSRSDQLIAMTLVDGSVTILIDSVGDIRDPHYWTY